MWDEDKRPTLANLVPPRPRECNCSACENSANIFFLVVRTPTGTEKTVDPGTVLQKRRNEWELKKGHEFVEWVARCSECYLRDLYRAGGGALQSIRKIMAPEVDTEIIDTAIEGIKR